MRDSFSGIERRFLEPYRSAFAWLTFAYRDRAGLAAPLS